MQSYAPFSRKHTHAAARSLTYREGIAEPRAPVDGAEAAAANQRAQAVAGLQGRLPWEERKRRVGFRCEGRFLPLGCKISHTPNFPTPAIARKLPIKCHTWRRYPSSKDPPRLRWGPAALRDLDGEGAPEPEA